MKKYDLNAWRELSYEQKLQAYESYRKTANRRLRRLRESGKEIPIDTLDYLEGQGTRTFTKKIGKKVDPELTIDIKLANVTHFLGLETSTLTGIKKVDEQISKRVRNYLEKYTNYSPEEISRLSSIDGKLIQFLHSNDFKKLRGKIDSFQLIEDYKSALFDGLTEKEIIQAFKDFAESEISQKEYDKRLKNAKRKIYSQNKK